MDDLIEYHCSYKKSDGKRCNKPFKVLQGSRRHYCGDHWAIAVTHADRRNIGGRPPDRKQPKKVVQMSAETMEVIKEGKSEGGVEAGKESQSQRVEEASVMNCPRCNSTNVVKYGSIGRWKAGVKHRVPRRICNSCGYQFVSRDKTPVKGEANG